MLANEPSASGVDHTADQLQTETDLQSLKKRSVRGAAATFAAQGLRFGLQFGSQIALARMLLPADFGLVAMIAPVLSFVQIFNELGLSQATIQRPQISQGQLTALFWINGGIGLVMAVIMMALSPLVALFYGEPRLTAACMCIATLLLVSGLSTQQIALMNRRMQFTTLAVIDVACSAIAVLAGVAGALYGMGYWSLILMQAVNSVTILVLSWLLSDWRPSRPRREPGVGEMLRFGGHLTSYNLINFAGTNCDSVLIGKLSGSVALGLYDRAFKLVGAPIWQVSLPVARVATSLLSRLHDSPDRYRDAFVRMLQILLLITVPAVVCVAMAADTLVPLLLGPAWNAATPIVAALAVATAFAPLSISSYWLFVSQNRAGEQLRYVAIKTGIALFALLAGIHWGSVGVARSYAVFGVLVHGSMLWGATRQGPVNRSVIVRGCYPVLIAAVAASAALWGFEDYVSVGIMPLVVRLGLEMGLSYAAFGVALLCWPDGVRILRGVWQLRSVFGRGAVAA